MPFDWQQFHANETRTPAVVDPRRRLRICLAGFVAALAVVFGRAVQLEVTQGADFREEALRPIEITIVLPAARGRILARDGSVLACDTTVQAVAVQYRWLQEPPDPRWLRITARSRMSKADRKDPRKLAAAQDALLAQHVDLMQRLAHLCGLSQQQWAARTKRIQARVQQIADDTNKRRQTEAAEPDSANDSWPTRIRRLLLDDPPPPRITVTEESDFHVVTVRCASVGRRRNPKQRRSLHRREGGGSVAAILSRRYVGRPPAWPSRTGREERTGGTGRCGAGCQPA